MAFHALMLMMMLLLAAAADDVFKVYETAESHKRQLSAQAMLTHQWDFRGCADDSPVTDAVDSTLVAHRMGSPTCSADGVATSHQNFLWIDSFELGGPLAIEVYYKSTTTCWNNPCNPGSYDGRWSSLFDFSNGHGGKDMPTGYESMAPCTSNPGVTCSNAHEGWLESILIRQTQNHATTRWELEGQQSADLISSVSTSTNAWQHLVVTADGTGRKIFQNGVQTATDSSTGLPAVLTRSAHLIGKCDNNNPFIGVFGYLRIYQGAEPAEGWASTVATLFANRAAFSSPPPPVPVVPSGLHLSDINAKICFGPNSECCMEYKDGPPAYLESSCPIVSPAPSPSSPPV